MSDLRPAGAEPPPETIVQAAAPDASKAMTLFVMVVVTLYLGKAVLMPITLALLLAFLLAPLVAFLRRLHLGRVPSVLIGVVVAIGLIFAIGAVIGTQIAELTKDLPHYAPAIEAKVNKVRAYTVGRITELADQVGVHGSGTRATGGTPAVGTSGARQQGAPAASAAPPSGSPQSGSPPSGSPPSGSTVLALGERYLSPGPVAAGDARHRLHRRGVRSAAAGGSARSTDPAARFGRHAPHHGGDR